MWVPEHKSVNEEGQRDYRNCCLAALGCYSWEHHRKLRVPIGDISDWSVNFQVFPPLLCWQVPPTTICFAQANTGGK